MYKKISTCRVKKQIQSSNFKSKLLIELPDQIHFIINNVKLTFFQLLYAINVSILFEKYFKVPDLLTLAAIKAFPYGGWRKWKDYVDLYFIRKDYYSIQQLILKAQSIFTDSFNPLLFKKQLWYVHYINYFEQVQFLPTFETDEQTIKNYLTEAAIQD